MCWQLVVHIQTAGGGFCTYLVWTGCFASQLVLFWAGLLYMFFLPHELAAMASDTGTLLLHCD
jgi:hypothetical protein